jgi:hypothetical protein
MNTVSVSGIGAVPGYDAAIPALLPRLWEQGRSRGSELLRLLGVSYAVLPVEDPGGPERRRGFEPILDPVPGARLYHVADVLPRVYLAGRAEVADDDAAVGRLLDRDVVAGDVALLARAPEATPLSGAAGRAGSCAVEAFANTRITARCRADQAGVAVFVEQYDVGWRAEVDGRRAPLLRANLLMRGVRLDPGEHAVTLSYSPPNVGLGGLMSVAALVAVALLAWTSRRSA